jgi:hypothetical protein
VFPVRYSHVYRVELSFKLKTARLVMSISAIVILIYLRHKPIDVITLITVFMSVKLGLSC